MAREGQFLKGPSVWLTASEAEVSPFYTIAVIPQQCSISSYAIYCYMTPHSLIPKTSDYFTLHAFLVDYSLYVYTLVINKVQSFGYFGWSHPSISFNHLSNDVYQARSSMQQSLNTSCLKIHIKQKVFVQEAKHRSNVLSAAVQCNYKCTKSINRRKHRKLITHILQGIEPSSRQLNVVYLHVKTLQKHKWICFFRYLRYSVHNTEDKDNK